MCNGCVCVSVCVGMWCVWVCVWCVCACVCVCADKSQPMLQRLNLQVPTHSTSCRQLYSYVQPLSILQTVSIPTLSLGIETVTTLSHRGK